MLCVICQSCTENALNIAAKLEGGIDSLETLNRAKWSALNLKYVVGDAKCFTSKMHLSCFSLQQNIVAHTHD